MEPIKDPVQIMKEAIFAALKEINPNVSPSYPASLFDDRNPPKWPLTVYNVSIAGDVVIARRDRFVRVTATIDHFATTRQVLSDIGVRTREAMMDIIPLCGVDAEGEHMPGKVFRRSQRFVGRWDLESGRIYER